MVQAHIELVQAELSEIMEDIAGVAALVGVSVALALFTGILVSVGTTLFLGEALFGSIGWGVVHGTAFCIAVIVALLLRAVNVSGDWLVRTFAVALIVGIVVGLLLVFNVTNTGWTRLAQVIAAGLAPESAPLVVALLTCAIAGAILGAVVGLSNGGGSSGFFTGLLGGLVLGLLLGAFTAATFGTRVGAAVGVTFTLVLWPILAARPVYRGEIDWEAQKERFIPHQSIDTAQETMEWLREQMPPSPKS